MKKNEKIIIFILLVVLIIAIIAFMVNQNKNVKELNNENMTEENNLVEENNTVEEEFTQLLDNGVKLNTSEELGKTKQVGSFKFENIQLTEQDDQSILLADVTNTSSKATDVTLVDVVLLDKNGKEIVTVGGIIKALKPGEKTHFMMTLFQDSFEKAEDELHQIFRNAPEDVSPVKFAAMDLLLGCMKFPYICAVDSEIHNKNWNLSVLQDGIKRICQCENTEEVLNCLLNLFGTLIKQNTEGTDERNRKLVQSVLSYIEKNYSGDLSMDDLTEKFHVSRTYISRLLKKYAGKSFLEYLTDVRFQQVEKLIADNKYKQYEIAEMVGYKDFGYYIKVFKKRYGITPNEFRKYI